MSVFSEIKIFQLGQNGINHALNDAVLGVFEMVATDQGGLDQFGNPTVSTAIEQDSAGTLNPSQSFVINGVEYLDVHSVDTGAIEIDGVMVDGARVTLADPNSGLDTEFFIPLQTDAADAATVQAGSVITAPFSVAAMDADALEYSQMYTPQNGIVLGTDGGDSIDAGYAGDPGQDRVDDPADANQNDTIHAGAGNDTINAGQGNNLVLGQAGDDRFIIQDGFGQDIFIGGETQETSGDMLDGSALTGNMNLDLTEQVITGFKAIVLEGTIDNSNPTLFTTLPTIRAVGDARITDIGQDTGVAGSSIDALESGSNQGDQGNTSVFVDGVTYSSFGGVYKIGLLTSNGNLQGYIVTAYAEGATDPTALYFPDQSSDISTVTDASFVFGWAMTGGQVAMPYDELIPTEIFRGATLGDGVNVSGFSEMETYVLGSGDDTVTGSDAGETINGGAGNDIINAGAGDDAIIAGAGNDLVDAGAGDDTIVLTQGSDTVETGPGDDLINWSGSGDVTLRDFGRDDSGSIDDGDQSNNDFIDLSRYYSHLRDLKADFLDDGVLNQSAGDFSETDAMDGSIVFADEQGAAYLSAQDFTFDNTNVACFSADVLIQTDKGLAKIADIRQGDVIETLDHGPQPVRWVGHRILQSDELQNFPNLVPIRIKRGALGQGMPRRDLIVSPQHRILIRSIIAERMFNQREVLVAAKRLLGLPGIRVAWDLDRVHYVHIMFEKHEILWADGAACESFFTGSQALNAWDAQTKNEIFQILPELESADFSTMVPARKFVQGAQARALIKRHAKNNRELVRNLRPINHLE